MEKHFSDLLKKTDSVTLDLLKLQEENKKLKQENEELQKHYDNSIHTDWIAEASGEDAEYFRDTCCATTLGNMIKENKKLNLHVKFLKEEIEELQEEVEERTVYSVLPEEGKFMEENETLKEQIVELGTLCRNIDDNAYNTWKEITNQK